jgi:hypothetical protein
VNRNPKNQFVKGAGGIGAPKGNRNAAKDAKWRKALDVALQEYEDLERGIAPGKALAHIAKECVRDALSTDADVRHQARTEIANRLDGKPKEHIEAEFTQRLAEELTDEQLLDIARGGSDGAVEAASSAEDDSIVH